MHIMHIPNYDEEERLKTKGRFASFGSWKAVLEEDPPLKSILKKKSNYPIPPSSSMLQGHNFSVHFINLLKTTGNQAKSVI